MFIRKVKPNNFDVFLGKGWNFHGRFFVKHTQFGNKLIQVSGNRFTREEFEEVESKLCQTNH